MDARKSVGYTFRMTPEPGRPQLPDRLRRDKKLPARVSPIDLERLAGWADHEGLGLTAYIRKRLRLDKEPPKKTH